MAKSTIKQILESHMQSYGHKCGSLELNAKEIMQASDIEDAPGRSLITKSMLFERVKEVMKEQNKTQCSIQLSLNDGASGTIADMVKAKATLNAEVSLWPDKTSTNHHIEFGLNNLDITKATDYAGLTKNQAWDRAIGAVIALMADYDCPKDGLGIDTSHFRFNWNAMSKVNLSDNALGEYTQTAIAKLMDSGFFFNSIQMNDNDVSDVVAQGIAGILKPHFQLIELDHNYIRDGGANSLFCMIKTFSQSYGFAVFPVVSMFDNHLVKGPLFSDDDPRGNMYFLDPELGWYTGTDVEMQFGRKGGYSQDSHKALLQKQRGVGESVKKLALASDAKDVAFAAAAAPAAAASSPLELKADDDEPVPCASAFQVVVDGVAALGAADTEAAADLQ